MAAKAGLGEKDHAPQKLAVSKTARMGRHIAWHVFNILVLKYCKTVFKHLELSSRNFKKEISLH